MNIIWTQALADTVSALSHDQEQTDDVRSRAREIARGARPGFKPDAAQVEFIQALRSRLDWSDLANAFQSAWSDAWEAARVGTPITHKSGARLIFEDGSPATWGQRIEKDGWAYVLAGGEPPRHAGSSGRVWLEPPGLTNGSTEAFPHVLGLRWASDAN